jgi:hypothetical protein
LLCALIWIAATVGAAEPAAEKSAPTPALDTSQGVPLPDLGKIAGKVTQTMDASEYTYIEIDTGNGLVWAAGPATKVKVGDTVETSSGFPMVNFHSATLDRTFDEIRFVSVIQVWSPKGGNSESAPADTQAAPGPSVSGIDRAEGGHTVAEIIEGRTKLSGSKIKVRGVVVKLNSGIMGRNWVHLSDGTVGPNGEQEITVNTEEVPAVGSTVLVHGTVAIDRDFGSGYQYSVLIEDAQVTVE